MSRLAVMPNRMVRPNHGPGGGDGALIANPRDAKATADSKEFALAMPPDVSKERWRRMLRYLQQNDITAWLLSVVRTLADARPTSR